MYNAFRTPEEWFFLIEGEGKMKKAKFLLIIVVLIFTSQLANAEIVSNSIIVDDIEYYMQVDDSVYNLGEDVEMLYRVTNLSDEEAGFGFPNSPEFNFWVEQDGENIRTAVEGWMTMPTSFTLLPDESKEYSWIWDMRDDWEQFGGVLVDPGLYDVIGGLDGGTSISTKEYEFTEVPVSITIVPEPGSLTLFLGGLFVLIRKKNN